MPTTKVPTGCARCLNCGRVFEVTDHGCPCHDDPADQTDDGQPVAA